MATTLDTLKQLCRKVAGDDFFEGCRDESHQFCVLNWIDEQADDPTHLGPQKTYTLRYMSAAFSGQALLLRSDDNKLIRKATIHEAMLSGLAGAEGYILVDGVECFVEA
jgi:hypothetical protein